MYSEPKSFDVRAQMEQMLTIAVPVAATLKRIAGLASDQDRFSDALLRALQCLSTPNMMGRFALLYDDLALWEQMADRLRLSTLRFDESDVEVMRWYRSPGMMFVGYWLMAALVALINNGVHSVGAGTGRMRFCPSLAGFFSGFS